MIPNTPMTWENLVLVLSITALPLLYLTVKNWTETWLVILAVISGFGICKSVLQWREIFPNRATVLIFGSLAFPFVAVFLSILIRGDVYWKLLPQNLDLLNGSSRLLLAAVAFLWMNYKKVNFISSFNISCSVCIILTLPFATTHQVGIPDRSTTSLIDLDEFSQQITLLALIQLIFLLFQPPLSRWLLLLNITSIIFALKMSIASGGRGGWIAIPPVILVAIILYRKSVLKSIFYLLLFVFMITAIVFANPSFRERALSIYTESRDWYVGNKRLSSAGHRMSMARISWALIRLNPIKGYASKYNLWTPVYNMNPELYLRKGFNYEDEEPARYTLCAVGDHNEYLGVFVYNGILGFLSRILLLIIPMLIFIKQLRITESKCYTANVLGICFILAFAVFGMTQAPFGYKMVCSFYGFVIAGLATESIRRSEI